MVEVKFCAKKRKVEHEQIDFKNLSLSKQHKQSRSVYTGGKLGPRDFALMIMIVMSVRGSIESDEPFCL